MVGGESLGCRTCKQRKIKVSGLHLGVPCFADVAECDERRPTCLNCEKSKRSCPGPESPFKYHYGCKEQRELLAIALAVKDPLHDNSSNPGDVVQTRELRWISEHTYIPLEKSPALTAADRIRQNLVHALKHPGQWFALQSIGLYFDKLPERVGRSQALDTAVDCFVSTYQNYDRRSVSANPAPRELMAYGKAIRALRQDIARTEAQYCSDTLCAALIMALYEFYLQEPTFAVVTLAGGVSSIFKRWGPSRFRNAFEMSIFSSHFVTSITHSMLFGTECAFDDDHWDDLLERCSGRHPTGRHIWTTMVRIARLLHDVRNASSYIPTHNRSIVATALHLLERVSELVKPTTKELDHVGVHYFAPSIYVGQHPVSTPTAEEQREAQQIIQRVSYVYTAVIIVNGAMKHLFDTESVDCLSQEAANFILATTPAAKVSENFYFNFVGPAAFGLVNDEGKRQIIETLQPSLMHLEDDSDEYRAYHKQVQAVYDAITGGPVFCHKDCD